MHTKGKRGQTTLFVILGLVIAVIIALIILIKTEVIPKPSFMRSAQEDMELVEEHITDCLLEKGDEFIRRIGFQGGYLNTPKGSFRLYADYPTSYLCYNQIGIATCINRLLTKENMERELSEAIQNSLPSCINIYEISHDITATGDYSTSTSIQDSQVEIKLNYPLTITKGDETVSQDEFIVLVNHPLGELYNVAMDIVNDEASLGEFDQLIYMLSKQNKYLITKDRPYPDKVYTIQRIYNGLIDDYIFRFAVQGESS